MVKECIECSRQREWSVQSLRREGLGAFPSGKAAIAFLCITGTQYVKESGRNKLFTWKGCQFCMNQVLFLFQYYRI